MMPAFHMLGLRDSLRTYRFGMAQDLVVNLVLIQTIDESFWYFHTASETNYHFPGVSLLCPRHPSPMRKIESRDAVSVRKNQLTTATKFTARETFMYGYMRSLRKRI